MATRRHRSKFPTLAYLAATLIACAAAADERVIEVITLRYELAADLLPSIKPLVETGGSATGVNNQIVLKASPENIADIKRVLAQLDRRQKLLKITVKQDVAAHSRIQQDAVSGRFESGDVRARVPDPGVHNGASVGIRDRHGNVVRYRSLNTRSNEDRANTHFVTTQEGQPALIQTGQALPYPYQSAVIDRYGAVITEGIDYRDVSSGFYVTPHTHGDRVTLSIAPQLEHANPARGGAIDTRFTSTTVSGRLGEWIPLGGLDESSDGHDNTLLARTRRYQAEVYGVWVLVEEMP